MSKAAYDKTIVFSGDREQRSTNKSFLPGLKSLFALPTTSSYFKKRPCMWKRRMRHEEKWGSGGLRVREREREMHTNIQLCKLIRTQSVVERIAETMTNLY